MSHRIIITSRAVGEAIVSSEGNAKASVDWTPSHHLTAQQTQRRIERAERMLNAVEEMLVHPPRADE